MALELSTMVQAEIQYMQMSDDFLYEKYVILDHIQSPTNLKFKAIPGYANKNIELIVFVVT